MNTPLEIGRPATKASGSARAQTAAERPIMDAALAGTVLLQALLFGLAGNALLYGLHAGISFPLFVGLLALGSVSLVWRSGRTMPREASGWLWTAFLFAAVRSWRDSDILQGFDLIATLGALGMAAVSLSQPLNGILARRLRDTVRAATTTLRTILAGVLPIALQEFFASAREGEHAAKVRPALRAAVIATALLVLFGSLLRGADPIFASLLTLPDFDGGELLAHVIFFGIIASLVGGWARAALMPPTARRGALDGLSFSLGSLEITSALGALNVLFALFVASQLGWFFGGERFLREATGLTAAQYARGGFFQMMWVVLLVVPLLVATRAALRPGYALARRHTMLSLPIIGLLGIMILSAVLRMRLYVQYFGLTTDRVYPLIFMGWLALVLIWLALTVLRGQGRTFVAGAVASGAAMLFALHVASVDVIVATVNIARPNNVYEPGIRELDLAYLSKLSGETARTTVLETIATREPATTVDGRARDQWQRCRAATTLLRRWGPNSEAALRTEKPAAWRFWNKGEADAVRVVGANATALRVRTRVHCAATSSMAGD